MIFKYDPKSSGWRVRAFLLAPGGGFLGLQTNVSLGTVQGTAFGHEAMRVHLLPDVACLFRHLGFSFRGSKAGPAFKGPRLTWRRIAVIFPHKRDPTSPLKFYSAVYNPGLRLCFSWSG